MIHPGPSSLSIPSTKSSMRSPARLIAKSGCAPSTPLPTTMAEDNNELHFGANSGFFGMGDGTCSTSTLPLQIAKKARERVIQGRSNSPPQAGFIIRNQSLLSLLDKSEPEDFDSDSASTFSSYTTSTTSPHDGDGDDEIVMAPVRTTFFSAQGGRNGRNTMAQISADGDFENDSNSMDSVSEGDPRDLFEGGGYRSTLSSQDHDRLTILLEQGLRDIYPPNVKMGRDMAITDNLSRNALALDTADLVPMGSHQRHYSKATSLPPFHLSELDLHFYMNGSVLALDQDNEVLDTAFGDASQRDSARLSAHNALITNTDNRLTTFNAILGAITTSFGSLVSILGSRVPEEDPEKKAEGSRDQPSKGKANIGRDSQPVLGNRNSSTEASLASDPSAGGSHCIIFGDVGTPSPFTPSSAQSHFSFSSSSSDGDTATEDTSNDDHATIVNGDLYYFKVKTALPVTLDYHTYRGSLDSILDPQRECHWSEIAPLERYVFGTSPVGGKREQ